MRPVAFGESLLAGTRLTLFFDDKPNRFFTVIKFWMDETSGVALALRGGVPTYQVEDAARLSSPKSCAPEVRLRRAYGVTSFGGGGRKAKLIYRPAN